MNRRDVSRYGRVNRRITYVEDKQEAWGGCTSLEPESGNWWYWRNIFSATSSTASSGGRSATGTRSTEPEGFSGTNANCQYLIP